MAAKKSQGNSVLTLVVQRECMMQMVIKQVLPFLSDDLLCDVTALLKKKSQMKFSHFHSFRKTITTIFTITYDLQFSCLII